MSAQQAHIHHYVPQWYQKRFMRAGQSEYFYLDLRPDVVEHKGERHLKRELWRQGPRPCFCANGLYTVKLGSWSTDQIETLFFGAIDNQGRRAVEFFSDYRGIHKGMGKSFHEAFQALPQYMDAQRFRTPRGLDSLRSAVDLRDKNQALMLMQRVFRFHTTMWMEGTWEIVRAVHSPTKFIVSDEPVTFFNRKAYPSECVYPQDAGLELVGTRTLFPLGLEACLVITHLQFVRNPWEKADLPRINARAYQNTLKKITDTQFGRELEEDEVLRINYILKKRATRYIAAAEEEWLYPEECVSITDWSKLDHDWFLFPHLYKVPFISEIMMGWKDGSAWAMDAYGRHPGNPKYRDQELHDREWFTHERAKREWARKRQGKSLAHVDKFEHDDVYDKIMADDLAKSV